MDQIQKPGHSFPYKRYLGLDFSKGFGIFSMIIIHSIIQQMAQYDGSLFATTVGTIPIPFLVMMVPVLFLALWGPAFVFFNVVGIIIQMSKFDPLDQIKRRKYILGRVIAGILILVFKRSILVIRYIISDIPDFNLKFRYFFATGADAVDAIAWASIICPIIYSVYIRLNKKEKHIYGIFFFAFLAFGWMMFSPLMIQFGENFIALLGSDGWAFLKVIINKIIGGRFKLVQTLSFGFVGVSFGLILTSTKNVKKNLIQLTGIMVGISIILTTIYILRDIDIINHFADEDVPLPLQLFNLGFFLPLFIFYFIHFDFCDPATRQRRAKRSNWMTRYSLISFTAFTLDTILTKIPYLLMTAIFGPPVETTLENSFIAWKFWQIIIYLVIVWLFWEALLRIWEKIKYIGSIDWFILLVLNKIRRKGMPQIPIQQILYDPIKEIPISHKNNQIDIAPSVLNSD